jgi:hypothetical protein
VENPTQSFVTTNPRQSDSSAVNPSPERQSVTESASETPQKRRSAQVRFTEETAPKSPAGVEQTKPQEFGGKRSQRQSEKPQNEEPASTTSKEAQSAKPPPKQEPLLENRQLHSEEPVESPSTVREYLVSDCLVAEMSAELHLPKQIVMEEPEPDDFPMKWHNAVNLEEDVSFEFEMRFDDVEF